ncbi:MAG: hypothetical protein OEQ47_10225 [Acidimicrobiia bacterium]|nr:hypothetical protein [Acidimicrobiia bacterium]
MTPPGGFVTNELLALLQTAGTDWTFSRDVDVFIGLAGIAGVFVGFAALIGLSRDDDVDAARFIDIRGVVTIGLLIIVVALVPVILGRYGLVDHALWLTSSLVFLTLLWTVMFYGMRRPENRAAMRAQAKAAPRLYVFFWVAGETPIQVSLLLIVFGVLPEFEPALYLTALVFQLFEAAYVLSELVYWRIGSTKVMEDSNQP